MRIPHISFKQKHLFFLCAGVTTVLLCFCLRSPDFDSFTMEIFRQELSGNTLSLHYTLADPASFDIAQKKFPLELSQPLRIRKAWLLFRIFR